MQALTRHETIRRWWDLVAMLAWRDIQIKYKQSVMGFAWAILMPALVVGAGITVQYGLSWYSGKPVDTRNLAAVSVKAVPWAFFVASVRFATSSLIANTTLVTKIYLPREVFPIAAVASQFADFCVAGTAMAVVFGIVGVGASLQLLWVPILVLALVTLCLGLGMFLSAAALFFRDVKYVVEVVVTFAIFFTPVFYPIEVFGRYADVAMLNPVAPLLESLVDVVVSHRAPQLPWLGYACGAAAVCLLGGYAVFRQLEPMFAERI